MRTLLATVALVLAFAAPAAAAANHDVAVANFAFTPPSVTVAQGDSVTWTFSGTDLNHSVTSSPNQAESFDTDPGAGSPLHTPGFTFQHTFNTPGTYTYFCKVHDFMQGKVIVTGPGGVLPPTDTTAPVISRAKVKKTTVTYHVDEAADISGTMKLAKSARGAHGGKTSKPVSQKAKKGTNKLKVTTLGLRAGTYKLTLRATDAAGNRSHAATVKLTVS